MLAPLTEIEEQEGFEPEPPIEEMGTQNTNIKFLLDKLSRMENAKVKKK